MVYVLEENNTYEDSEYFWLTKLSAYCSSKRLVPDYISEKKMKELKEGNVFPCMGCVDGQEIIKYRFENNTYTESFERMWDRFSKIYEIKTQQNGIDKYIDLQNVSIYDPKENDFVDCYRIIKNHSTKWLNVKIGGGRSLKCTYDHPFETENRGVVHAIDLTCDDVIRVNYTNDKYDTKYHMNENNAWLLGFMLCDGTYRNKISSSVAMHDEDDIVNRVRLSLKENFNLDTKVKLRERGSKGNYKDIDALSDGLGGIAKASAYFTEMYRGQKKQNRQIPNLIFESSYSNRMSFLAGMVDADGYVNTSTRNKTSVCQIGSTNKELALQQLYLIQSLGMVAKVYQNHYNKQKTENIRYLIEFSPTSEFIEYLTCQKKALKFTIPRKTNEDNLQHIQSVEEIDYDGYSYDVTTESEHFEVSGIYSHNCRSFLSPESFSSTGTPYGHFNWGVTTINLVDIALSSNKNIYEFWKIFDDRLEMCKEAMLIRYEYLKGTPSDVAPILWQNGALARLKKGETIDRLLLKDYSTVSLGYAGLYECVYYMTGKSHTDAEATPFALEVMQHLNDKCEEWKSETGLGCSVYGSPQ